jgi:hypothetical protein
MIEIKNVYGDVIYAAPDAKTVKFAVEAAVKDGASLIGACLIGAHLDGASLHGARLHGASLHGAHLDGASLHGARLIGASLIGASLHGARLDGASLIGASLDGARLDGALVDGKKITSLRVVSYSGYRYQVQSVLFQDGSRWVRMGCLWKSLEDWEEIGIRNSNPSEFPDDGSEKSEERATAFEFAKATALRLKLPESEGK